MTLMREGTEYLKISGFSVELADQLIRMKEATRVATSIQVISLDKKG